MRRSWPAPPGRLADDRSDVDDAPPTSLQHRAHDGLGHQEGAGEVGGEHVVPVFALHAQGEGVARDACIIDEDFNLAELGDHSLGEAWMDSSLLRSSAKGCAVPPAAAISAATSASFASLRAASATVAPASASANAHARPIPCDAPVTNATRPASVLICLPLPQSSPLYEPTGDSSTEIREHIARRMTYPCREMPDKLPAAADPKQAVVTPSAPLAKPSAEPVANQTDVYAIQGAEPEVLASAMAKYSRSALSMKESLAEIGAQRAEEFLNTFYFQYGHRSIADLAHIAFAVER